MNIYMDLPLPIGCKINWNFIPEPSGNATLRKIEEHIALREVRTAVNAWLYSEDNAQGTESPG